MINHNVYIKNTIKSSNTSKASTSTESTKMLYKDNKKDLEAKPTKTHVGGY